MISRFLLFIFGLCFIVSLSIHLSDVRKIEKEKELSPQAKEYLETMRRVQGSPVPSPPKEPRAAAFLFGVIFSSLVAYDLYFLRAHWNKLSAGKREKMRLSYLILFVGFAVSLITLFWDLEISLWLLALSVAVFFVPFYGELHREVEKFFDKKESSNKEKERDERLDTEKKSSTIFGIFDDDDDKK